MSNRAFNRLLKEFPVLYFVLAAVILGAKAFNVPPTSAMSWLVLGLVSAVFCAFGAFGLRSKAKAKAA